MDRGFLDRVLEKFGFGVEFRKWMCVLYEGACAKVICNEELTEGICLEKGIWQGCSLSPMLYVLVAEVLACNVRAERWIQSFLVPGSGGLVSNISQYADDTTAILKDTVSAGVLLDVVELYGKETGARLNRTKSEAMWVGSWKGRVEKAYGLKWVVKMKILGVWFGDNVQDENLVVKCEKLKNVLDLWSSRNLSIRGRVLILVCRN